MERERLQADQRKMMMQAEESAWAKVWGLGRTEDSRNTAGGCGGYGARTGGGEGGGVGWGLESQAEEFGLYPGGSENLGRIFGRG